MFIKLGKTIINTDQIATIEEDYIVVGMAKVTVSKDELQKVLDSVMPRTRKTKDVAPKNELNILFDELHTLTGGKGKAVFSLNREKKLNDLITKHRLTPEILKVAAENIGKDAFLQGDNDSKKRYGDIDYLLRPDKAAKWSEVVVQRKRGMFQ